MANLNFNAETVPPNAAFDPVPAGWYNARIVESTMKPTKAGDGMYLELQLEIIDGQYANRKLFDRLNLENKNPVAKEIAQQTLSAICHATGVIQVQDSQQLHGIPMEVKVKVTPATDDYEASNEVKGYRALATGGGQGMPQGQPQQQQPQQGPGGWGGQPQQQPQNQQQPVQQQGGWNGQPQDQGQPQQQPQNQQQPVQQQQPQSQPGFEQQPQQQAPNWGQQPQGQPQQQGQDQQPGGQATGHPTQGPAPSAGHPQGTPPWGQ